MYVTRKSKITAVIAAVLLLAALFGTDAVAAGGKGKGPATDPDEAVLDRLRDINQALVEQGLNVQIAGLDVFRIGQGRSEFRLLQDELRWVPGDGRRIAQANDLTYIFDLRGGAISTVGLGPPATELRIDRAMATWDGTARTPDIVKRVDPGTDITIFDFFVGFPPFGGFGAFGNPFAADIVHAGWFPPPFFDAVFGGPGAGASVLAFSVPFVFTDAGIPTDVNNDGYLDTALNEVYYQDKSFDTPIGTGDWGIDVPIPGIDVQTVALHESGHSLGLLHFGEPPRSLFRTPNTNAPRSQLPRAVMNPFYQGLLLDPQPTDVAGLSTLYGSWPAR